jgi:hypothetical protein
MKRVLTLALLLSALGLLGGCASVRPWERGVLASEPMKPGDCRSHRFERAVETYREGAVGGAGGKSGGGCGCS